MLIQTARYFCDHAALHEEAPPGFTACLIELKGDPDHDHWGGVFIAHDDFYQTPLGHPFIVNCGPIGLPCEVSYTYCYRLNLAFRYWFPHHAGPLPIADIVARDRQARNRIAAELVQDYPWPKPDEDAPRHRNNADAASARSGSADSFLTAPSGVLDGATETVILRKM